MRFTRNCLPFFVSFNAAAYKANAIRSSDRFSSFVFRKKRRNNRKNYTVSYLTISFFVRPFNGSRNAYLEYDLKY